MLRRTLPPVNSLVIFEAAARHLNFTRAAAEMGLTQAAVSRQIQVLEENLGVTLFIRQARGLTMTREGTRLQYAVTMGLEYISKTCVDIRRKRHPRELTVSSSVSFASYWLMSRLAKFRAEHPDVDLRLVASAPVADLVSAGIDIAIRYGSGGWDGVEVEPLFGNEIWPVCAPQYLEKRPPLQNAADLAEETLLHLGAFDRNWVTWDTWFKGLGIDLKKLKRGFTFDNYLILLQAAVRGEGIALCGQRLAEDFIARGDLVRPVPVALTSERSFYVVHPKDIPLSEPAALFKDWLIAEGGKAAA
ncbi:LysR substrate-binding domain-containing protein [Methyloraptor flagellatus]|uniref:LysR substrate-binding domain-containing protein n=1 Tax=Methyloraptor flagellatus TaxID=3162530 RepID=A0AAU7XGN7_9HYPH